MQKRGEEEETQRDGDGGREKKRSRGERETERRDRHGKKKGERGMGRPFTDLS